MKSCDGKPRRYGVNVISNPKGYTSGSWAWQWQWLQPHDSTPRAWREGNLIYLIELGVQNQLLLDLVFPKLWAWEVDTSWGSLGSDSSALFFSLSFSVHSFTIYLSVSRKGRLLRHPYLLTEINLLHKCVTLWQRYCHLTCPLSLKQIVFCRNCIFFWNLFLFS